MYKWIRIYILAAIAFVTIFATNASASSDTNQIPKRGQGSTGISGYVISNVHYRPAENPSYLGAVELDLDSPASQVIIGFDNPSDQSFTCHNVDQLHWLCYVENVRIAEINQIKVVSVN